MSVNAYASSLRGDRAALDRPVEEGVPFFVPQLSKVKTTVMCQSKHQQHLLFCFEKQQPIEAACYRKQGNQDLYSEANLARRRELQQDSLVLGALARFWDTFPAVRLGQATLSRRDYVDVFLKFFKALVAPSEFSIAEARQIVERDWQRDVGEADAMSRPMFLGALFEVADLWTVGIGQQIYASFLHKLYDRVTMTVYDQEKRVWLTVFADLDKIRPFASEPAAPGPREDNNATASDPAAAPATAQATAQAVAIASKPPLLKKKMQSVPSGLGGSPSKPAAHWTATADALGSSLRRLPDLPPRPPLSPTSPPTSRSEERASPSPSSSDAVVDIPERVAPLPSPTRATPKRSKGPSAFKLHSPEDDSSSVAGAPPPPELPPQQVRLSMPSIYLSPEITPARGAEKAARRRIQESMKLAQRLRRITF